MTNVQGSLVGLTDKDVSDRIERGEYNKIQRAPSKTLTQILIGNFFTMFNALNVVLAAAVIIAGSPKNAIFAVVIVTNSVIGTIQELKAKKIVEELSVINEASCIVVRNGQKKKIGIEEIVKDDIVFLTTGDQVLADGYIVNSSELETDESMLTGEADPIAKKENKKMLSGSFIVAGEGYMKVTGVGAGTYSSKLADEARKFKMTNSEIQKDTNKVLKYLLFIIIPVGILLATTQGFSQDATWQEAVIGTVSGVIGMVPEGLVLITSATFVVSIIKLFKQNTLIQELSATEVLARVDVLCVDKTGTITKGDLKFVDIDLIGGFDKKYVDSVLSTIAYELPSKNPTQQAILDNYDGSLNINIKDKVPFSSKRKWGGIISEDGVSFILGAPEIIMGDAYSTIEDRVNKEAIKGRRVLGVAKSSNSDLKNGLIGDVEPMGLVLIEDIIREDAPETLKFFKEEGVIVKVISGDNPVTVSAVAKRAGVFGSEKYVDARTLPESVEELKGEVDKYNVFGRVTPHQKKALVKALQAKNHTVAMTGDGVNDVLALKEADCGIAMANGSDATKAVAQLVLMKSNFSALPKVVAEGRQQINNLEVVAKLFLSKTVYSVILAVAFSLMLKPFPIDPLQLSLIGTLAIGIPAFFVAMFPNRERVEKGFLRRVLKDIIPNGILVAILVWLSYAISIKYGFTIEYSQTVTVLFLTCLSFVILFKSAGRVTILKLILYAGIIIAVIPCFVTPFGQYIFSFTNVGMLEWVSSIVVAAICMPILMGISYLMKRKQKNIVNA